MRSRSDLVASVVGVLMEAAAVVRGEVALLAEVEVEVRAATMAAAACLAASTTAVA